MTASSDKIGKLLLPRWPQVGLQVSIVDFAQGGGLDEPVMKKEETTLPMNIGGFVTTFY